LGRGDSQGEHVGTGLDRQPFVGVHKPRLLRL
jgi:hypothetical protein